VIGSGEGGGGLVVVRFDSNVFLMEQHPSVTVNHRELAVAHIFRLAETCKYLSVVGDADRPSTTRRWTVNAAEKLAKRIIANYDNPLQSSTIDVPAHVESLLKA
jgi:hypothetical protein